MPEPTPGGVAMLALAYRELASNYDGGDLSLSAKMIHDILPLEEDALFEAFENSELLAALLPDLAATTPVRAEAVLHAFPSPDGPPDAEWARRFIARWEEVEAMMDVFTSLGLARA